MKFDEECAACLRRSQLRRVGGDETDPKVKAYMTDIDEVIRTAPRTVSAPYCVPGFARALKQHFGIDDAYADIKRESNESAMAFLPRIREIVAQAEDRVEMALKFSRTGNYFDFAILPADQIRQELAGAVEHTPRQELDPTEFARFRADVKAAKTMLFLADNAGEIAFDLVLAEELKREFPDLDLRYVVRGANAQNDATRADAAAVGMDKLVPILDNGSGIPGTELDYCGQELLEAIREADVILAKGQGNFESLLGCGLNVYYAFLCKCPRLCRILGSEPMTGKLICERRLPELND